MVCRREPGQGLDEKVRAAGLVAGEAKGGAHEENRASSPVHEPGHLQRKAGLSRAGEDMEERYVKLNRSRFADHLRREAYGLGVLRTAAAGTGIDVPAMIDVDERSLTMTRIRAVAGSPGQWARLGHGLAGIHAQPQACFGFEESNYIGMNPQSNDPDDSWGRFFAGQRLGFQVGLIEDERLRRGFSQALAAAAARLREFLDAERASPSLLHGDLWRGNVLCGDDGRVWLIDPAPYYGDAEADLAMTEMFGGFPAEFYAAYHARRPRSARYALKARIYNLYHYLNHFNLFGAGYLEGCEAGFAALDEI